MKYLSDGVYVVEDFEEITEIELSKEQAEEFDLDPGAQSIEFLYNDTDADIELLLGDEYFFVTDDPPGPPVGVVCFRGKIIWSIKTSEEADSTRSPSVFRNVPAGTLIVTEY